MIRGSAALTPDPVWRPATRPAIRAIPAVVARTARVLTAQQAAGQPITPARAGRVMARQTARTIGRPRAVRAGRPPQRARRAGRPPNRRASAAGCGDPPARVARPAAAARRPVARSMPARRPAPAPLRSPSCATCDQPAAGQSWSDAMNASTHPRAASAARARRRRGAGSAPTRTRAPARAQGTLAPWLRAQALNLRRHAAALGPLRREEFEAGRATVTEGHIRATNALMTALRRELLAVTAELPHRIGARRRAPRPSSSGWSSRRRAATTLCWIERVWDFYFELFSQRQSQFGPWLLACDRIALDCYQAAYTRHRGGAAGPGAGAVLRTCAPASRRPRSGAGCRCAGSAAFEPVPADPAALSPARQSVDARRGAARGLPQPPERPRARASRAASDRATLAREGLPPVASRTWHALEPRDLRRPRRLLLGGPAVVALADGRGRTRARTVVDYLGAGRTRRRGCGCSSRSSCCGAWASSARPSSAIAGPWLRLYPDRRSGGSRARSCGPRRGRHRRGGRHDLLPAVPEPRRPAARRRRSASSPRTRRRSRRGRAAAGRGHRPGRRPAALSDRRRPRVALDRRYARPASSPTASTANWWSGDGP